MIGHVSISCPHAHRLDARSNISQLELMENTPQKIIIGIDPGFTGAIAVLTVADAPKLVALIDMPLRAASRLNPGATKNNIDVHALAQFIKRWATDPNVELALAVVECVNAAPDQGVVSMFRFGEGFGMLKGVLAAFNVRLSLPLPAVWKAAMNVSHVKSTSLELARFHMGAIEDLRLNKHHGRAEAILLALYGIRGLGIKLARTGEIKSQSLF
jgi:crossover junction endodeoxyribonuclease RuvC